MSRWGLFGAIFAISNVCGPLLGGLFTTNISWRWCFYLNLPMGSTAAFILFFTVKGSPTKNTDSFRQKLEKMDNFGTLVFIPGLMCILLALQWGGNTYDWGNARIIVLFILGGFLLMLFIIIQFKAGENATLPIRIIKQRSIAAAVWFSFFNSGSLYILIYYLPLWFQASQGLDAINSGFRTIPLVLALALGNIFAGIFTKAIGYYVPMVIASSVIAAIGAGLLTTLRLDSGPREWMSWPVIFGWGIGLGMQQANLAVQACLQDDDISTGLAFILFAQSLGGTIFVTIGQAIFSHELVKNLSALNLTSLPASLILHAGATELRKVVPSLHVEDILAAYNIAITKTFLAAIVTSAASLFACLTMEWKNLKKIKRNSELEVTSPSASHGSGDEEPPHLLRSSGGTKVAQTGLPRGLGLGNTLNTPPPSSNLLDLQQQLETIREEREKSSSVETSPNVNGEKSSGDKAKGIDSVTSMVSEKGLNVVDDDDDDDDDEIRAVG
ncbi:hypothetical protein NHQ30_005106 [Ciborinia camelliae]|nr:hypothetical protein NHQ30_005106 [Ciborinia camelliae]